MKPTSRLALNLALVATLLAATTCAPSTAPTATTPPKLDMAAGLTKETLLSNVGKQIIVSGIWNENGKSGPFIFTADVNAAEPSKSEPVYIVCRNDRGLKKINAFYAMHQEGMPVEITGMLQHLNPPAPRKI